MSLFVTEARTPVLLDCFFADCTSQGYVIIQTARCRVQRVGSRHTPVTSLRRCQGCVILRLCRSARVTQARGASFGLPRIRSGQLLCCCLRPMRRPWLWVLWWARAALGVDADAVLRGTSAGTGLVSLADFWHGTDPSVAAYQRLCSSVPASHRGTGVGAGRPAFRGARRTPSKRTGVGVLAGALEQDRPRS